MEFTMSAGSVPAGNYRAVFVVAEPYLGHVEQFGEGVSLIWRVLGGSHDGETASRICSMTMSAKSTLGKFALSFAGKAIPPGSRFSFAQHVGRQGSILVEATEAGGSRVTAFFPDPPAPQQYEQPASEERF